jgi:hypothetical protein
MNLLMIYNEIYIYSVTFRILNYLYLTRIKNERMDVRLSDSVINLIAIQNV